MHRMLQGVAPMGERVSTVTRPLRLLVPCRILSPVGGLLRFDRIARAIAPWGHRISFLPMESASPAFAAFADVITLAQAQAEAWDAVMIPGAGFPAPFIARFRQFQAANYGVRVQHILNDESRRPAFLAVNAAFDPDLILFNNRAWSQEGRTGFRGRHVVVLEGAVDSTHFAPSVSDAPLARMDGRLPGAVLLGGQARKNPAPLIAALDHLPRHVTLLLFGPPPAELADIHQDKIRAGRLILLGQLDETGLRHFYHKVDMIISTELVAGWSNMAAEACASGVPLICTAHGTAAFARHGETALVLDKPDVPSIATAIRQVMDDRQASLRRATLAREAIAVYNWPDYSAALLRHIFAAMADGDA